jgi:putative tRNA adenosine deaminase-associated protein
VSYFAVAVARTGGHWTGVEVDLDEVDDLEGLTDLLRDLTGDGPGPALLLLEEDDEYVAVVRVDGGASSLGEPRVFLSDRRAVQASEVAALLWEEGDLTEEGGEEDDDDEGTRPVAEPVGDADLLADVGTPRDQLLRLCAEEGLLPADVITSICERAGCDDVLEELREG